MYVVKSQCIESVISSIDIAWNYLNRREDFTIKWIFNFASLTKTSWTSANDNVMIAILLTGSIHLGPNIVTLDSFENIWK